MKKNLLVKILMGIIVIGAVASLFFLNESLGNSKTDSLIIRSEIVSKLQVVIDSEQRFYDEYWVLVDEGDASLFLKSRDDFVLAYADLDAYIGSLVFSKELAVVMDIYVKKYKVFVDSYLDYIDEFSKIIKEKGFIYEDMESYFPKMQEFTDQFINVNNELVLAMNDFNQTK